MEKLLVLILATTACLSAAKFEGLKFDSFEIPQLSAETQQKLGRIFTLTLLNYLSRAEFSGDDDLETGILPEFEQGLESGFQLVKFDEGVEPRMPVLPGFEQDVLPLPDLHIYIPEESGVSDWFYGDIHFCDVTIGGLTSIINDLRFNLSSLPRAKLNFVLYTGLIRIEGTQDTYVNFTGIRPAAEPFIFSANEQFFFEVENFTLDVRAEIEDIWTKFNVDVFVIDKIEFPAIRINFQNAVLDDTILNDAYWVDLSNAITTRITDALVNIIILINYFIPPVVENLLDECRLWNVIIGEFSCVGKASENEVPEAFNGIQDMLLKDLSDFATFSESDICPADTLAPGQTTPLPNGVAGLTSTILLPLFLVILLTFFKKN